MGLLINGVWHPVEPPAETGGKFVRNESIFRNWITKEGSSGFKAEPDRYHLYLSLACPWACRTLIFRTLKKLENIITLSIVSPRIHENGWAFADYPGVIPDTVNHSSFLHEIYTKADPTYTGRVTVPVLWDKKQKALVNNESSEIIRMFNSEFSEFTDVDYDFYPDELSSEIDEINAFVYKRINNGVYKCGFATTQEPYEYAFDQLFSALDEIEKRLTTQEYLVRNQITEADWRLFTTLLRFDAVYYSHFKCNLHQIRDYKHIQNYMIKLYQIPEIKKTVNMDHIKTHYYGSHKSINPTGIIPKGPQLDWL